MTDWREEYRRWCNPPFDGDTRAELAAVTDEDELQDRFYRQLTFGTGGLRGIMGAGTNRMNVYTVGRATQGLADFINLSSANGSAVIAYDSRKMSAEFALDSALILAANGIHAYLFEGLRPTPELSFAVRKLGATAGIVITASHNPPQYNGYKVYWSDGGQIVPPYDKLIIERVNAVTDYAQIKRIGLQEAQSRGLLCYVGGEIDDAYVAEIKKCVLNPSEIEACADLSIVYTPLNGTGNLPVRRVLAELGFKNVRVVPEQELPDGAFPTLKYPNPEDPAAFTLALALAKNTGAQLVLATDPDADRLGILVKDGQEYIPFNGNMTGIIIADYLLSQRSKAGLLPKNGEGRIVSTIVSTDMIFPLAEEYGLKVIRTLTGFKYVGEQIKLFESAPAGGPKYVFGFEESYGCLVGSYARDKDGVSAVAVLCEAAAYYKNRGMTLWQRMKQLYAKYGWYKEDQYSLALGGAEGARRGEDICQGLRNNPPSEVGGFKVLKFTDYRAGKATDFTSGRVTATALPASNVLYFDLENSGWCCLRPSGTEPKIKLYFGVKGQSEKEASAALNKISQSFKKLLLK